MVAARHLFTHTYTRASARGDGKAACEESAEVSGRSHDTRAQNFVQCAGRWPSSRPLKSTLPSPLCGILSPFQDSFSRRVSSSEPIVAKPPSNDPQAPLNNPRESVSHPQFRKSTGADIIFFVCNVSWGEKKRKERGGRERERGRKKERKKGRDEGRNSVT